MQHNCSIAKNKYLFLKKKKKIQLDKKYRSKIYTKSIAINRHQLPLVALWPIFWKASQTKVLHCSRGSKDCLAHSFDRLSLSKVKSEARLLIHMVESCMLLCSCEKFLPIWAISFRPVVRTNADEYFYYSSHLDLQKYYIWSKLQEQFLFSKVWVAEISHWLVKRVWYTASRARQPAHSTE